MGNVNTSFAAPRLMLVAGGAQLLTTRKMLRQKQVRQSDSQSVPFGPKKGR